MDYAFAVRLLQAAAEHLGIEREGVRVRLTLVSYERGVECLSVFAESSAVPVRVITVEDFNSDASVADESYAMLIEASAPHYHSLVCNSRSLDERAWCLGQHFVSEAYFREPLRVGQYTQVVIMPEYSFRAFCAAINYLKPLSCIL